jgi:Tol biopolymer transport system component
MYHVVEFEVEQSQNPVMSGNVVFTAPGPGAPGAKNVFIYDFDTGTETQLTGFAGVGYLFHEPRINPTGTHHMHCAGPTPEYSNVVMYEFGGDSWTIETDEVDDFADFHPDGVHILTASGTEWGNTMDLYEMEYDGANRTLLATAPDTIQNPMWCPDANRIAMILGYNYTGPDSSLWIYDVNTCVFTEIMAAPGAEQTPNWSPVTVNGAYLLAFSSNRDNYPDPLFDLYIVNPDTEEVKLHLSADVSLLHPTFSPDGLSIMFSAELESDDSELIIYPWYTDGDFVYITDDDDYDTEPHWSWGW